jgi:hypothetical protein
LPFFILFEKVVMQSLLLLCLCIGGLINFNEAVAGMLWIHTATIFHSYYINKPNDKLCTGPYDVATVQLNQEISFSVSPGSSVFYRAARAYAFEKYRIVSTVIGGEALIEWSSCVPPGLWSSIATTTSLSLRSLNGTFEFTVHYCFC